MDVFVHTIGRIWLGTCCLVLAAPLELFVPSLRRRLWTSILKIPQSFDCFSENQQRFTRSERGDHLAVNQHASSLALKISCSRAACPIKPQRGPNGRPQECDRIVRHPDLFPPLPSSARLTLALATTTSNVKPSPTDSPSRRTTRTPREDRMALRAPSS